MKNLIIAMFFISSFSWGASPKRIRIGTFLIPKYIKSNSDGAFVELVTALAKKSNVEIEIVLFPPKRAYKELDEGNIDGLFPAMESRDLSRYEAITEFYIKEMYVFEREGHDYRKIKQAKVCTTEGYTYPEEYIKSMNWVRIKTDSDETCLKLLDKQRVDIFIGEIVTANNSIKKLDLEDRIKFNRYRPISADRTTLVFRKTDEGKKLSDKFDKALKEIMIDRTYDKILSTGATKLEH